MTQGGRRRASPFEASAQGVRVLVRASPKSSRSGVAGLMPRPDGRAELKVGLRAPPEGGKANEELIGVLAEAWGLPRRSLTLAAGAADRRKVVLVAGEAVPLLARLEGWLEGALAPSRR